MSSGLDVPHGVALSRGQVQCEWVGCVYELQRGSVWGDNSAGIGSLYGTVSWRDVRSCERTVKREL